MGANTAATPIRGEYDKTTPASLIHYVTDDPLTTTTPAPEEAVTLVLYDLDGTLIKPRYGGKFPKAADDWTWWDASVPKRLKADVEEGKHVIVLSNQAAKSPKLRRAWMEKIPLIAEKVRLKTRRKTHLSPADETDSHGSLPRPRCDRARCVPQAAYRHVRLCGGAV
jgi:hypothetical protein